MSTPNFHRVLFSPSNTSINKLIVTDALPRPVHEINGLPSDRSNQLLPEVDPRIPTVGQHTLGVYANYKPNFMLPDWRKDRNQQESTPLEREIATEERAAIERLRAPREGDQWTNGAHAESTSALSIQGKSGDYRLRSSSFVGETVAQTIDKILPTTPAQVPINQQQLVPIAAPPQSEICEERHLENPISMINNRVNVDLVPVEIATNALD